MQGIRRPNKMAFSLDAVRKGKTFPVPNRAFEEDWLATSNARRWGCRSMKSTAPSFAQTQVLLKFFWAGSSQPRDADALSRHVTKNSNCDIFDRQGMKPLHTSMIVKRLQLTIPFRDRTRSNFAHQQSERAWLNHHDAIRRSSRMP